MDLRLLRRPSWIVLSVTVGAVLALFSAATDLSGHAATADGSRASAASPASGAGAEKSPEPTAHSHVQGRTARLCLMALGTHKEYRLRHGGIVDLVIVSPERKPKQVLGKARAAHPEANVFAYLNTMDIMLSRAEEGASFWNKHEEWFLHDGAGERVRVRVRSYKGRTARYAMNVAHPGYQDYLGEKAAALLKVGYDGIQLDNVETAYSYKERYVGRFVSALPVPEEMTEEKWYAGEAAMLRRIRAIANEAGFRDREVIFNHIRAGEPDRSMEYLAEVDGANAESWLDKGVGPEGRWGWRSRVELARRAAKAGKRTNLLCSSSGPNRKEALFTFASYLMAVAGERSTFWYGKPYRVENMPWYDFYEIDLGAPAGEMASIENGLYRRDFDEGIVVVNPGGAPAAASLGGPFWNEMYEELESVEMPAKSAAILRRPGAKAPQRWSVEAESCLEDREGEGAPPAGLGRLAGGAFSGGAAVEFSNTRDLCVVAVSLPAGKYRVAVEGEGKGLRADAAQIRLGSGFRRVAFHPSRRHVFTAEIGSALDAITLKGAEAGVAVDRVILVRIGEAR